jgi:hypothetical protein
VWLVFHVNDGRYGGVDLAGLNFLVVATVAGPMGAGNWTVAAYIDARASQDQQGALGAIFTGAAGGPLSAIAPLIGTNLGVKVVPIEYRNDGKKRSAVIPGILNSTIEAVPGISPDGLVVKNGANPLFPENWIQASGVEATYKDYSFDWDNTGKCADYAAFRWSGP